MTPSSSSYRVLQRITENRTRPHPAGEHCDMCADPIADQHQHVVDAEAGSLLCVCRCCYLLFIDRTAALRYRAVPERYRNFSDFTVGQAEWDRLQIPVGLAFFFRNSTLGRMVAFYPGPAGATESELPLEGWQALVDAHPEIDVVADDVEALLIRVPQRGTVEARCLLLPIDVCYEFVGHIRMLWRGFDGGQDVRRYIEDFFDRTDARAGIPR